MPWLFSSSAFSLSLGSIGRLRLSIIIDILQLLARQPRRQTLLVSRLSLGMSAVPLAAEILTWTLMRVAFDENIITVNYSSVSPPLIVCTFSVFSI